MATKDKYSYLPHDVHVRRGDVDDPSVPGGKRPNIVTVRGGQMLADADLSAEELKSLPPGVVRTATTAEMQAAEARKEREAQAAAARETTLATVERTGRYAARRAELEREMEERLALEMREEEDAAHAAGVESGAIAPSAMPGLTDKEAQTAGKAADKADAQAEKERAAADRAGRRR